MPKKAEKNPNAVALGSLGGKTRARKLTPEQRKEIARKAVLVRWAKAKNLKKTKKGKEPQEE